MGKDLTLSLSAEAFIPHRLPMRLVDTLISYRDAAGEVEAVPAADCILVGEDGLLDEAALVELMAQGYAVIKGYLDTQNGDEISQGYLVGVRKISITGTARAGDRLLIRIRTVGNFEGFAVADGEIVCGEETIAKGTIKLWIAGQGSIA